MSNRDWALLGVKLVGMWVCVTEMIALAHMPPHWMGNTEGHMSQVLWALVSHLAALGVGLCVWFQAAALAARIFPTASEVPLVGRLDPKRLLGVALTVIGVTLITSAVSTLTLVPAKLAFAWQVSQDLAKDNPKAFENLLDASVKASLVEAVVRLAMGIGLVLGPARLRSTLLALKMEFTGMGQDGEAGPGGAV